jgi:hypothetical protein
MYWNGFSELKSRLSMVIQTADRALVGPSVMMLSLILNHSCHIGAHGGS